MAAPVQATAQPEDDVLLELNADLHRSKAELIERFLLDQEELNRRFEEYELQSDNEDERKHRRPQPQGHLDYENILHDLEVTSVVDLDNLSTCSAVHSSKGSKGSIADLSDLEALVPSSGSSQNTEQKTVPRQHKKNPSKPKKILTKKAIRPKTSCGFREVVRVSSEEEENAEDCKPATADVSAYRSSLWMSPPQQRSASRMLMAGRERLLVTPKSARLRPIPDSDMSRLSQDSPDMSSDRLYMPVRASNNIMPVSRSRKPGDSSYTDYMAPRDNGKRRQIRVLKLPPLSGTLETSLVGAVNKDSTLQSAEFLAG